MELFELMTGAKLHSNKLAAPSKAGLFPGTRGQVSFNQDPCKQTNTNVWPRPARGYSTYRLGAARGLLYCQLVNHRAGMQPTI